MWVAPGMSAVFVKIEFLAMDKNGGCVCVICCSWQLPLISYHGYTNLDLAHPMKDKVIYGTPTSLNALMNRIYYTCR